MIKKLLSLFKKEVPEKVLEEVVEEIGGEDNVDMAILDSQEESEDLLETEPITYEVLDVDISPHKESAFEVYIGETEESAIQVNIESDISNLDEAKSFAQRFLSINFPNREAVVFIHEETEDENGNSVTYRHYI